MNEQERRSIQRRRGFSIMKIVRKSLRALFLFFRDKMYDDVALVIDNSRLFIGMAFVLLGSLSFSSDRYCDGNTSNYATCTRPATYYYYPWWAITLIILGSFLIVLWFFRSHRK